MAHSKRIWHDEAPLSDEQKEAIFRRFADDLTSNTIELDSAIAKAVDENIEELLA